MQVSDADLKGKWSVFFFYPADFTFVCPTELGDLADQYAEFQKLGVEIYSVSTDTHFTHKAWHDASDTIKKIEYPMVGDPTHAISRNFGVLIEDEGLALRGTFVVNPEGMIKVVEINDIGIGRDAKELLRKVQAAQYVAVAPGRSLPGQVDARREDAGPVARPRRQDLSRALPTPPASAGGASSGGTPRCSTRTCRTQAAVVPRPHDPADRAHRDARRQRRLAGDAGAAGGRRVPVDADHAREA